MTVPYVTLAGFLAGGAAVGLATGTVIAPNTLSAFLPESSAPEQSDGAATADPATAAQTPAATPEPGSGEEQTTSAMATELRTLMDDLTERAAALDARSLALEQEFHRLSKIEEVLDERADELAALEAQLAEAPEPVLQPVELAEETTGQTADTIVLPAGLVPEQSFPTLISSVLELETASEPDEPVELAAADPSVPEQEINAAFPVGTPDEESQAVPLAEVEPEVKRRTFADGPMAEIHFELNSAELTPGARQRALEAAEKAASMSIARIRIVGLTDTSGPAAFNNALSQQRAEAVAEVFVQAGLSRRVIEVVGMGEATNLLPIRTANGIREPLNRCVGILIEEAVPLESL